MKRGFLAMALLTAFVLTMIAPVVSADEDALHVIILTGNGPYSQGDKVHVEAHVFERDSYVDADQAPKAVLMVEGDHFLDTYRESEMQKISPGKYAADFEIFDSDWMSDDRAYIGLSNELEVSEYRMAAITRGWDGEEDEKYDFIEPNDFRTRTVELDPDDLDKGLSITYEMRSLDSFPWEPGEEVEFVINVLDNGVRVEPDIFYVGMELDYRNYYDELLVPYNNPEDGLYEAMLTIPTNIKSSGDIDIFARATRFGREAFLQFSIPVNLYQIWINHVDQNNTMMAFDIYIANMMGELVPGQEVGIRYLNSTGRVQEIMTTDEESKVSVMVEELMDNYLDLEIWVDDGTFNHTEDSYLYHTIVDDDTGPDDDPEVPNPGGYGFSVRTLDYLIDPLTETTKEFWGFYDHEPMNRSNIYYYVYTEQEIIGTGTAQTDAEGKFLVRFNQPLLEFDELNIDFQGEFGYHPGIFVGYDWEDTDHDGFSDNFEIEIGTDPTDYSDRPQTAIHSDYDGFTDEFELHVGTDPEDADDYPKGYTDSDQDGFGDAFEEDEGTDPLDYNDFPTDLPDSDGDGYPDDFEIANGTNPNNRYIHPADYPDTDGDGICDGMEEFYGTDPTDELDYPQDSYRVNSDEDYIEVYYTEDEQYDLEEEFYGTDPEDPFDYPFDPYQIDTDGDYFCDDEENFYGTDPEDPYDKPLNIFEYDSDYDDICDEEEIFYGTDPNDYNDAPDDVPDPWDPRYEDHNSTDGKKYLLTHLQMSLVETNTLDSMCDDDICLGIEDFQIGEVNQIWSKGKKGQEEQHASYLVGDVVDINEMIQSNSHLAWESFDNSNMIYMFEMDEGLQGCFIPPSFLPGLQQDYTIIGGDDGALNYMVVQNGGSSSVGSHDESSDEGGNIPWILIFFGIPGSIIIIIIITNLLLIKKKKGSKKEDEVRKADQEPTPGSGLTSGGPSVSQGPAAPPVDQMKPAAQTPVTPAPPPVVQKEPAVQPQPQQEPRPPAPQARIEPEVKQEPPLTQPPVENDLNVQQEPPAVQEPAQQDVPPKPAVEEKPEKPKEDPFGLEDIFS